MSYSGKGYLPAYNRRFAVKPAMGGYYLHHTDEHEEAVDVRHFPVSKRFLRFKRERLVEKGKIVKGRKD